jgi:Leucine-rich repeat (LRR) protein
LRWLRLDKTNLQEIPVELGSLQKLEHISLRRNELEKVFGELTSLPCLRTINLRYNKIKSSGVPPQIFELDDLTNLDLSYNNLKDLPQGLDKAKSLLVLNLSNNK